MTEENSSASELIELASGIVAAFVSNNSVTTADLPDLIVQVHGALQGLGNTMLPPAAEELKPAVPVKKSVTDDFIVCLEDGKRFKSLKRHLRSTFNLTPDEYRAKWGLPKDYPMVAPSYAVARSNLAKTMGLGRRRESEAPATDKGRRRTAA